jgi:predicted MPP superfamily phosphohydrolase
LTVRPLVPGDSRKLALAKNVPAFGRHRAGSLQQRPVALEISSRRYVKAISMRVLHLSDLHATARSAPDQRILVNSMFEDVLELHSQKPIDLVVVSGDLAFGGTADDLTLAKTLLLDPLTEKLGLAPGHVVIVPGNHDIDRERIVSFVEVGLRETLSDRDAVNSVLDNATLLEQATARLTAWNAFHKGYYVDAAIEDAAPLAWVHRFEIENRTIGVAALNTSWRASGGPKDRHHLLIGDRQLYSALGRIEQCDIRLVTMHHPLDWLADFDADGARREFERRTTIVLSGHEHVLNPTTEMTPRGNAVYARVGCLYESRDYPNTYAVMDINSNGMSVDFHLRTWWPDRHAYDQATDVAAGGVIRLPLPRRGDQQAARQPSFSTVLSSLADLVQRGSVIADRLSEMSTATVEDLLIPPRFWPVPYREAAAAVQLDKGRRPERADPLSDLTDFRVTIVAGEPEAGVTSSLLWLLGRHFAIDGTRFPIFLPFDSRFDKRRFPKAIRDAAIQGGLPLSSDDELPPLLIALDDTSAHNGKALARLARYIAEDRPDNTYVLGCHGDSHEAVATALRDNGVTCRRVFLGPFGRRELRQLVEKSIGPAAGDIVDRIYNVMQGEHLPRSPFIMSILIAVMSNDVDISELNESAVLQSYVNLLLGRDDIGDPEGLAMDYRRREHLLGWIARELTVSGEDRKARLETEEILAAYFRARGWASMSPGRVLDSLIHRRVLVEDPSGVGFRYPAVRHLFAAKWMLDETEFADVLLPDCLRHSDTIRHAAGLKRSDRALLDTVGSAVAVLLDNIGNEVTVEMFDLIEDRHGWSNARDIEDLKSMLTPEAAPPSVEQVDAWIDDIDTVAEGKGVESATSLPEPLASLLHAVSLLSDVFRSSELVDDVPLKVEQLKRAIHGWSLIAVVLAVREDQTHSSRDLLAQLIFEGTAGGKGADEEDAAFLLDRVVGLVVTFATTIAVASSLANVHVEQILVAVLDDEEFMSSAAHALYSTLLYCHMKLPGWPDRLDSLYRRHRAHPFVSELVRTWALVSYRSATTARTDVARLESFLAGIYTEGVAGGPTAVQARAAARSNVLLELRGGRAKAPVGPRRVEVFDPLDDDGETAPRSPPARFVVEQRSCHCAPGSWARVRHESGAT